jgi:acetyl esterase/lipase
MKSLGQGEIDVQNVRAKVDGLWLSARAPKGWRLRAADSATGGVPGEWIEPTDFKAAGVDPATRRTVLFLHGGGYFFCSPKTHRAITCTLAAAVPARVFAPAYRLAPEHPLPAALDDALAAYRQLLAEGTPANEIVVSGDSAGGGLALALLLTLRDAGEPLPACAALFSPWTDLAATGATLQSNAETDVSFDARSLRAAAKLYLGDADETDWRASPLFGDLSGLPPLLIHASTSEILLDDARRVSDKASAAGVTVDFREWQGLPHAWHLFAAFLPEGRVALRQAAEFMRQRLDTPA